MTACDDLLTAVKQNDAAWLHALLTENIGLASCRGEDGLSAVMLARYRGNEEALRLLLAAGPELDLFEAAAAGDAVRLTALLDRDAAAVHAFAPDGFTALHLAAFFGSTDCATELLQRGADPNVVATNGSYLRPLHSAAAGRHIAICAALLERGAEANARQHGGFTPLHAAAQHGDEPLAELLLRYGADPRAATDAGQDAIVLAREHGHVGLAERLQAVAMAG